MTHLATTPGRSFPELPRASYRRALPTEDERTWAMLAHLSFFVLAIVGPIIIMLTKGRSSEYVNDQAVEALIFQLICLVLSVIVGVLFFLSVIASLFSGVSSWSRFGLLAEIALLVGATWLAILATMAAHRGERARYPRLGTGI